MICSRCGATMSDDQIFCLECGHEIIYVPLYNAEEDVLNIDDIFSDDSASNIVKEKDETESNDYAGDSVINASSNNKNNKKSKKAIIITLTVIVLLIIGFVTYYLVTSNSFDYQYNKALAAIDNKDYKSAEVHARRAAEIDSANTDALLTFVQAQLGNKNYEEAYNAINVLVEKDSSAVMYEKIFEVLLEFEDYGQIGHLLLGITDDEVIKKYQQYLISIPKFNYSGGNYNREIQLEISTDSDADIYFSLDGSDPLKGNLYKGEIKLTAGSYELRAVAVNPYKISSPEKSASFVIEPKAPDMPQINTSNKVINKDTRVILECQKGCTMYYTWDGTTPTTNSQEYKGPIEIPKGNNIISVIAVDDYGQMSSVAKKNYILNENVEE